MHRALPLALLLVLVAATPAVPAGPACVEAPAEGISIRVAATGTAGFQPGCVRLLGTGRVIFTNADVGVVAVKGPCFFTGHLEPGETATVAFQRDAEGALLARDPFSLTPCASPGERANLPYKDSLHPGRAGTVIVEIVA